MNDLVTVTCNRDRDIMLLQAKSIQRFLEPCRHWVIINEKNPNIGKWQSLLKPYYQNHELIIMPVHNIFNTYDYNPQFTQQSCKLLMSSKIKSKYLCLDSKNFFIKPASILEWSDYLGNGRIEFVESPPEDFSKYQPHPVGQSETWADTIRSYSEKLNKPCPIYYLAPTTPFTIQSDLIETFLDEKDPTSTLLYRKDGSFVDSPSEFIYYSVQITQYFDFGKNIIIDPSLIKSQTCWYFDYSAESKTLESLETDVNNSNVKVFGLHSKFIPMCTAGQLKIINSWLRNLGLDHTITN